jgi:hypothetical protein
MLTAANGNICPAKPNPETIIGPWCVFLQQQQDTLLPTPGPAGPARKARADDHEGTKLLRPSAEVLLDVKRHKMGHNQAHAKNAHTSVCARLTCCWTSSSLAQPEPRWSLAA